MKNYIFTRAVIRNIAPDLTSAQEDAVIELYLEAARRFKNQIQKLETEKRALSESVGDSA